MTKSTRVKIFRSETCREKVRVFMKELNVSEYDAYVEMMLTENSLYQQFVEFQNGASSGTDMKGNIYYGEKTNLFFRASNPGIGYPWFEVTGKDNKAHIHNFYEKETWDIIIDGIKYSITRKPDGDGCKLFEVYVNGE